MAVSLLRPLAAAACVLAATIASGQDRSQYAPATPTLTERLGRVRDTILGIGENDGMGRGEGATASAPAGRQLSDANRKGVPVRPSQSQVGAQSATGRGYSDPGGGSGRRAGGVATAPAQGRNVSTDQIQHEELPSLARRPSFAPSRPVHSAPSMGNAAASDFARRPLQERLSGAAAPQADIQPQTTASASQAPGETTAQAGTTSSRRANPWANSAPPASNVQQIVNPTIGAASAGASVLPSLTRSSPTPGASAVTTYPTAAALTSSRRNPTGDAPAERVASAMPARDRAAAAVGAAGADADLLFKRQSPLVSVETTGPRTILIGKEATYTVIVQNAGDVAAQEVTVTVQVPSWADCTAAKETSGSAHVPQPAGASSDAAEGAPQTIQWTLPRLEAKSSERLSLQIVPRQSRAFDLAVQWTFTPIASTAVVQVQEPKLAMNLAGPSEVLFGDTKVYTMTLSNPGTGDAENVVIHLSPLNGQSGAPTKHQIGAIKAGSNKVIEVELTARQAGNLVIHAAATADGGLEAEVSEEVVVRRAELETKIAGGKVKYAGAVASYQIAVNNPGNAPAENVRVTAQLPAGSKFVAAGSGGQPSADGTRVQWTIPTIRAGGDARLDLKCQLHSPGANRLAVQSSAAGELSSSAEETSQVEALADLKLDVVEPKGPIAVGADVIYEIKVQNRGTKAARDVKVVGYFSGKIDPIGATGGEHRVVPGIVVFNPIASLDAGDDMTFKVTARAKAPGSHMFKAEVLCEAAGAKLGSEHTTLFYGDETESAAADETKPHEDAPRPIVPRSPFESDHGGRPAAAPALQAVPSPQTGSAYAPSSGPAETSGRTPGALPLSPFAPRSSAKK